MRDNKYRLLARAMSDGTGGVSGERYDPGDKLTPKSSLTSYSKRLGPFLASLEDGGTVIDKWAVPYDVGASIVISGPMVDLALPDGEVSECPEIPSYMTSPGALQGGFKTLAQARQRDPKWRGLDSVSLREFTAMWRDAGARVGRRVCDDIHWEDGEVEPIPPLDDYKVWSNCDACTRVE